MSELAQKSSLSNHTISFYNKKGLLPDSISTSKNMKYYPAITLTVLNLIKYFKDNLNFPIDYIKELFDYYDIDFTQRDKLIINSLKMMAYEIKNPIKKESLQEYSIDMAISIGLLEDKDIYFKTDIEILYIFSELKEYNVATKLIKEYIQSAKRLATIEKELSDKVSDERGDVPEILVLEILNKFKPYIFNKETIKKFEE
jgi:DNA-binding transcriptional MerR regulator